MSHIEFKNRNTCMILAKKTMLWQVILNNNKNININIIVRKIELIQSKVITLQRRWIRRWSIFANLNYVNEIDNYMQIYIYIYIYIYINNVKTITYKVKDYGKENVKTRFL